MSNVHPSASLGFSARAETYVEGRPDYPAEVVDWLSSSLALAPGKRVLDLGAGTGKFSPSLLATGATVLALDAVPAMLAQLSARYPEIETLHGSADSIPLPDNSLDAVVCAQSFHWFATQAALQEIHRVLKPGASLGLIWNVRDETVAWVAALSQIIAPYEAGTPRFHTQSWQQLFLSPNRQAPGFTPLRQQTLPHTHTGSPEQVILARTLSVSFIAALLPSEQERVAAEVHQLIANSPELAGKSTVTFPYATQLFSCAKL